MPAQDLLKREHQSLEDGTAQCTDRLESLRSKTVTLELEITILKAQRTTDHAKISDVQRDVCTWQESSRVLTDHLQLMGQDLECLQAISDLLQESYGTAQSLPEDLCSQNDVLFTLASEFERSGMLTVQQLEPAHD